MMIVICYNQVDNLEERLDSIEERFDSFEEVLEKVLERLDSLNGKKQENDVMLLKEE